MSVQKAILLTGATGMVGKEIFRYLMLDTNEKVVLIFNKTKPITDLSDYLKIIFPKAKNLKIYEDRVSIIYGDITKHDLDVDLSSKLLLQNEITDIIHSAGSTNFSLPIDKSRKFNVEGTKNVLELAKSFKNKIRFGYISTAFVAGKKTGTINEVVSDNKSGFVNSYEQSKYEAEQYLLCDQKEIPVVIYRLSTVLGDYASGETDKYIAPHQMMRLIYLGLISMIPGTSDYPVDLISLDVTASTIVKLFTQHFSDGEIFHITGGIGKAYPLQEMLDDTFTLFEEYNNEWKKREIAKPILVSKDSFDLFLRSVEETENPLMVQIVNNTKYFADQLLYPKDFNHDTILKYIGDYNDKMPDVRDFYAKIVRYCLMKNWK